MIIENEILGYIKQLNDSNKCKLFYKSLLIALIAHEGQCDKGGNDYIEHPLRVMNDVKSYEGKILALLHDVIEDSDVNYEQIRNAKIPEHIINSLKIITKPKKMDYFTYIKRIKNDSLAKEVKISDLKDNMNIRRIKAPTEKDYKRLEKYKKAFKILISDEF